MHLRKFFCDLCHIINIFFIVFPFTYSFNCVPALSVLIWDVSDLHNIFLAIECHSMCAALD